MLPRLCRSMASALLLLTCKSIPYQITTRHRVTTMLYKRPTTKLDRYDSQSGTSWHFGLHWDCFALLLVIVCIGGLGLAAKNMLAPYHAGQPMLIHLQAKYLPYYALRTVLRMLIALFFSFAMTFIFATLAAKNRLAEKIIIPAIDILQSAPVLSFLTITVPVFLYLFPHNMLGPECAAIFAIFTAQVWNMALSFYQSLISVPRDMHAAADVFQLSAWQRFWRVEVPFAMPGLLWNAMMSMSGSWVFLIAAEAITVAGRNLALPGVGSYIATAISQANLHAVYNAIITMLLVIIIYDQILFRPLVVWAEKFKNEITSSDAEPQSWIYQIFVRSAVSKMLTRTLDMVFDFIINQRLFRRRKNKPVRTIRTQDRQHKLLSILQPLLVYCGLMYLAWLLCVYLIGHSSWAQARHLCLLGAITGMRVLILIALCSLLWVPVGIWVGMHPRWSRYIQIIAQFLAAFPVNLLFPFIVTAILRYHLNINYWSAPLMVLGTQWYILFNVVAGTQAIPSEQHAAAKSFRVHGWLWWRRLMLPAIFPYYITGAMTAAGGAWNMSIIAEALNWGPHQLYATGLGAFISRVSATGDMGALTLATVIMSLYVVIINRLVWKPLYQLASNRYSSGN